MPDFSSALFKILGDRIKKRREESDLSQGELSERIKLGRTSISNIEAGRQQTPLNILYEICAALDIDVHAILPTYAEIQQQITPEEQELDRYIENLEIDPATLDQIRRLIKKRPKDVQL